MSLSTHTGAVKRRLELFSLAAALYQASRMFCSAIDQLYLIALGFNAQSLLALHAIHSVAFGLLNVPIAFYADAFSRKKVVFSGLVSVALYLLIYALLGQMMGLGYEGYCWHLVVLAQMFYGLGRQSVSLALNGWVVSQISPSFRSQLFPYFSHTTQNYNTLFSLVSGSIGILLACWVGYALCYGVALAFMLFSLAFFAYLGWTEVKPSGVSTEEETISKPSLRFQVGWWTTLLDQGIESVKAVLRSPAYGGYVLAGTMLVALARWITYRFWQALLFGESIHLGPNLPYALVFQLTLCNLGMYLAQFLTNRMLKSPRPFSRLYYRRIHQILALGGLASVALACTGIFKSQGLLLGWLIALLAFSGLQGTVGSLQVVQDNLYVQSLDPQRLSSCISMLQLAGRLAQAGGSLAVQPYIRGMGAISTLYWIPALALLGFQCLLPFWSRALQTDAKGQPAEAPQPHGDAR